MWPGTRIRLLVLVAALTAAFGGAAWWWLSAGRDPRGPEIAAVRLPSSGEMQLMESQAQEACRCERRLPEGHSARDACWAEFNRSIDRFSYSESSSMCIPLSTTLVCFGEGFHNCIVKEHGGGACTAEEARILESIWTRWAGDDQASWDRAGERMREAVEAFIRGERVAMAGPAGGCSS